MDDLCLTVGFFAIVFIFGMAAGYLLRDMQVKNGIYPRKKPEDDAEEEAEAESKKPESKDPEIVKAVDLPEPEKKKDGDVIGNAPGP